MSLSRTALILFACTAALSGCSSVQPLYAPGGQTSTHLQASEEQLRSVSISVAGTAYFQQSLLNRLIFDMRGGAAESDTRYRLAVTATAPAASIAIDEDLNRPSASVINATARFQLFPAGSAKPVFIGTAFTTVTYDRSSQRFANERALRDAQDRAARALSDDIAQRIAVYFATQAPAAPAPNS